MTNGIRKYGDLFKENIHNIIRQHIKFKGLIMSDDMTMKANHYDIKKSIFKCNQAEIDIP